MKLPTEWAEESLKFLQEFINEDRYLVPEEDIVHWRSYDNVSEEERKRLQSDPELDSFHQDRRVEIIFKFEDTFTTISVDEKEVIRKALKVRAKIMDTVDKNWKNKFPDRVLKGV